MCTHRLSVGGVRWTVTTKMQPMVMRMAPRFSSSSIRRPMPSTLTPMSVTPFGMSQNRLFSTASASGLTVPGVGLVPTDDFCNVPPHILAKVGRNLHLIPNHPLNILKTAIEKSLPDFAKFDALPPVVSTQQNFDSLLIPADHPSRSRGDTYYFSRSMLLRPQTSAHQHELLKGGHAPFLCSGDVYRRDEIDPTHYPVFHQMEGVKVMENADVGTVVKDLKATLEQMTRNLFGQLGASDVRWVDAYFPFTDPSFELEIKFNGDWLETLGCGVTQQQILIDAGVDDGSGKKRAWAFGLGLERIAMALFKIPDIRLFWSTNPRFLSQFADGKIRDFQPLVSLKDYPVNKQVVSFWIPPTFVANDFFDLIRKMPFADLVESVAQIDAFTHPKTNRSSRAFEVRFRSPEKTLPTKEVNVHMTYLREVLTKELGVQLR